MRKQITREQFDELAGIGPADTAQDVRRKRTIAAQAMRHAWKSRTPGAVAGAVDAAILSFPRMSGAMTAIRDIVDAIIPPRLSKQVSVDAFRRGSVILEIDSAATRFQLSRDGFAKRLIDAAPAGVSIKRVKFRIRGMTR